MKKNVISVCRRRRGVSAVLVAAMLFVFVVCAALTVDVAYMQLVRTELRVATDAAAQAGAENLARTEDRALAIEEAKRLARQNQVAGAPFEIDSSDVVFGRVTLSDTGRWKFAKDQEPPNSVQVLGRISDHARTKAIPLFFATALGHGRFSTHHSAIASRQDVEVCLALDRSGSMLFDLSGDDWAFPDDNPYLSDFTDWGPLWQNLLSPPHPDDSRWTVLSDAVDVFLAEAGRNSLAPRVGLVTWANDYRMPIPPRRWFPASAVDFPLPSRNRSNWPANAQSIHDAIADRASAPMMGGTNMSAGLDAAVAQLTGPHSSGLANKTVILLSDGQWNAGRDPEDAATDAWRAGIIVHTVSLLSRDQATLQDVARITGGSFYAAENEDELREAFRELARTLPIVLTD